MVYENSGTMLSGTIPAASIIGCDLHVALLTAKTMRIVALLRVMPGNSRLDRILLALID